MEGLDHMGKSSLRGKSGIFPVIIYDALLGTQRCDDSIKEVFWGIMVRFGATVAGRAEYSVASDSDASELTYSALLPAGDRYRDAEGREKVLVFVC